LTYNSPFCISNPFQRGLQKGRRKNLNAEDLCFMSAREMASGIRERAFSPLEAVDAVLSRIGKVNPVVNAFCTLVPEMARESARKAEQKIMGGGKVGPLHGVPVAIKDLTPTAGIRTTYGSKIFENHIPDEDGLIVARLKAAGAIVIGKTNTPEFGAGGNTYNAVFGATRNPWKPSLTCGGSSGGSAVALASGLSSLATGNDLGGSLRIPASFCGVVGFRTSPGLVPIYPGPLGWDTLAIDGPMARNVGDTALFLSIIAGLDDRSPLSFPVNGRAFVSAVEKPEIRGSRVAWSSDLGMIPVDREVADVAARAAKRFSELGCNVEEAEPDFNGVREVISVTRSLRMVALYGNDFEKWRDLMNPSLAWNIEQGFSLTGTQIGEAEKERTAIYHRVCHFFEHYDLLLTPTVAVPPFPVESPYPREINGQPIRDIMDWVLPTYAISVTGLPAISIPCGWTSDGLPVGLQIVGRRLGETTVLKAAAAFEAMAPWHDKRPTL
jgi:amidase